MNGFARSGTMPGAGLQECGTAVRGSRQCARDPSGLKALDAEY